MRRRRSPHKHAHVLWAHIIHWKHGYSLCFHQMTLYTLRHRQKALRVSGSVLCYRVETDKDNLSTSPYYITFMCVSHTCERKQTKCSALFSVCFLHDICHVGGPCSRNVVNGSAGQLDLLCFALLFVYVQYVLALAAPSLNRCRPGREEMAQWQGNVRMQA